MERQPPDAGGRGKIVAIVLGVFFVGLLIGVGLVLLLNRKNDTTATTVAGANTATGVAVRTGATDGGSNGTTPGSSPDTSPGSSSPSTARPSASPNPTATPSPPPSSPTQAGQSPVSTAGGPTSPLVVNAPPPPNCLLSEAPPFGGPKPSTPNPDVTISWTTPNATSVDVSVDGPGVYKTYPGSKGSDEFPFVCPGPHTYVITAHEPNGVTPTKTLTIKEA
jgi:hypothetical protein